MCLWSREIECSRASAIVPTRHATGVRHGDAGSFRPPHSHSRFYLSSASVSSLLSPESFIGAPLP
jgi:hypothetical protein